MKSVMLCLFLLAIVALFLVQPLYVSAQTPTTGAADAKVATPRGADGHPDLNGVWTNEFDAVGGTSFSGSGLVYTASCCGNSRLGGLYSGEQDGRVMGKGDRNKPMYKPEYWAKVRDNELHSQQRDPQLSCQPWGVPRMGQPQQIVQQDDLIVFLYSTTSFDDTYRVIAMNRPHDPDRVAQAVSKGDSVGHWEGDTLVVDTIGFDDQTWLSGKLGYIHSDQLHVVERFTRTGNEMRYDVTIDDPVALLQPWVWAPRTMKLNPNPKAMLPENFPCSERDVNYTPVR
jgi:hypothetical protein